MLFHINDKFLYKDTECVVVYINAGMAWLATLEDPYVTIATIKKNGTDSEGNKVTAINNKECLAV